MNMSDSFGSGASDTSLDAASDFGPLTAVARRIEHLTLENIAMRKRIVRQRNALKHYQALWNVYMGGYIKGGWTAPSGSATAAAKSSEQRPKDGDRSAPAK
jgi:hypothetical protein